MDLDLRTVKSAPISPSGVAAFLIVRDEQYQLPNFFEHHRAIGVSAFVVYADRCNRETLEILAEQPDAYVVTSSLAFGDRVATHRLPHALKANVPDAFFPQRWWLTVDADERFILPPPFTGISQLVAGLDAARQVYCLAPLIDLYPARLIDRNAALTDLFFDAGPYYTIDPQFPTPTTIERGVRARLLRMLEQLFPDDVAAIYGANKPAAPVNIKTPLLKHGGGSALLCQRALTRKGAPRISSTATCLLRRL